MARSTTFRSREIGSTGQMESELTELLQSGRLDGREIYTMGSILLAAEVNSVLKRYDKCIEAIVDNDPKKAGIKECDGDSYTILTTGDFLKRRDEKTVLIIFSIRYWREMADQMLRNGFIENKDLYVLEALTLDKKIGYINRGVDLYSRLCRKYGENVCILVFYGPIGDNFFFSLFIRDYLREHDISSAVFLGDKVSAKILGMFSFSPYEEITRDDLLALEFLYMFSEEAAKHIKILQIWEFCFHFNRCRIRFDIRFNFMDTYRHYVYGLGDDAKPEIPAFNTSEEWLSGLFSRLELQKGKTAVIAPYAYSIEVHPRKAFWLALSEGLKDKGYDIAVNIDPEREVNFIPDSKVISFELKDSVPVLEYAGVFIGMRSGFCDISASAICRKVILYPKVDMSVIDYDRHRNDMDFGSLNLMGLSKDAYEVEFEDSEDLDYWKRLAEKIINYIIK